MVHEPFFDIHAFGRTEIDGVVYTTVEALVDGFNAMANGPDIFFKETTDHRYEAILRNRRFLAGARHAFLIRRPEEVVASYHALYPAMEQHEVGLETLHELYRAVARAGGHRPIVIDSDDLVASPAAVMAAYCDAVGLPFLPEALRWQPEDRPEWRRTARWHARTAATSGFERTDRNHHHNVENSPRLAEFARHHRPFYDTLRLQRLRVDTAGK